MLSIANEQLRAACDTADEVINTEGSRVICCKFMKSTGAGRLIDCVVKNQRILNKTMEPKGRDFHSKSYAFLSSDSNFRQILSTWGSANVAVLFQESRWDTLTGGSLLR
jgi:hypothetical protein